MAWMAPWCLAGGVVFAQEGPDSLAQPVVPPDPASFMGFASTEVRAEVEDTLLHFDHDVTATLAQRAGSMAYEFGSFGWPSAWSYLGSSPNHVALYWQGIPLGDLLTGRPRYDLLPTALLRTPGVGQGTRAMPVSIFTRLRSFRSAKPHTELHYQAGDNGLQRVTALHTQQIQTAVLGSPGLAQGLFAYGGAAAKGEYPGSKLQRMRQLMLGVRYQQLRWSFEALYLHNQRRLGAHGGVMPMALYDSIYNRLIAVTRNATAVRREVRHDATAVLRMRTLATPLTLQAWLSSARLRYIPGATDAIEAGSSRLGMQLHQHVQYGLHRFRMLTEVSVQERRMQAHIAVLDSVQRGAFLVTGETGITLVQRSVLASATLSTAYRSLYALAYTVGVVPAHMATAGFGPFAKTLASAPIGRTAQVRLGLRTSRGALRVDLSVFAGQENDLVEFYGPRSDSMVARVHPGPLHLYGAAVDVGLRRSAPRGFYVHAHMLYLTLLGDVPSGREKAVPTLSGQARLGARYQLFTGDLRLDLSVRARLWSAMTSRTLHAPTGLLVLSENPMLYPDGEKLPASAVVDVVAEAGVRSAVLFAAYENILSGTALMAGNQVVPIYPMPAFQLRFGVFWPIAN